MRRAVKKILTEKGLLKKKKIMPDNTRVIFFKCLYSAAIPAAVFIAAEAFDYTLNLFAIILFIAGVLITPPFFMTIYYIKHALRHSLTQLLITDFLSVTVTAVFSSLIYEIVNVVRFGQTDFSGLTTALLAPIFLLINAAFALLTIKISKKINRGKK